MQQNHRDVILILSCLEAAQAPCHGVGQARPEREWQVCEGARSTPIQEGAGVHTVLFVVRAIVWVICFIPLSDTPPATAPPYTEEECAACKATLSDLPQAITLGVMMPPLCCSPVPDRAPGVQLHGHRVLQGQTTDSLVQAAAGRTITVGKELQAVIGILSSSSSGSAVTMMDPDKEKVARCCQGMGEASERKARGRPRTGKEWNATSFSSSLDSALCGKQASSFCPSSMSKTTEHTANTQSFASAASGLLMPTGRRHANKG